MRKTIYIEWKYETFFFVIKKQARERENELKWNQNDRQGHFIVKKNVHICLFESQIQIFQIFSIWSSSSFNQLAI